MAFVKHGDVKLLNVVDKEEKKIKCARCGKIMKKEGKNYKCECGNETEELEINE